MDACRKFLSTNPLELMIYAGRHIYRDYLDDAAPRIMERDLKDVTRRMPEPVYDAWVSEFKYQLIDASAIYAKIVSIL